MLNHIRGFSSMRTSLQYMTRTRIVPTLPTFYSANPVHENNINRLEYLISKSGRIPKKIAVTDPLLLSKNKQPPMHWLTLEEYRNLTGSGVRLKPTQYEQLIYYLNKLNALDPELINEEVKLEMDKYNRDKLISSNGKTTQDGTYKIPQLDSQGRSIAVGRRKSASAKCYTVKGEGLILVNDRPLNDYFVNIKDRESIMYPLQVVQALGRFNIYALTSGGGTTGQADAISLALGKSLLAFNPLWKSRLHSAGCLTTDYRRVERKKPGKLKARKMPTWVKR
ncbi:small ribosomal subunit protein uS9m [Monosporozyma servazzii]